MYNFRLQIVFFTVSSYAFTSLTLTASNQTGSGIPNTVDWRQSGCVTPVKDQLECDACYAFATVSVLESALCLHKQRRTTVAESERELLSVQEIIDCSWPERNAGCGGGYPAKALKYIFLSREGQLTRDTCYEFIGADTESGCRLKDILQQNNAQSCAVDVSSNGSLSFWAIKSGENEMKSALAKHGPLVGLVYDSDEFNAFRGSNSVVDDTQEAYDEEIAFATHSIAIIGYGVDNETQTPYWLVQNSWGSEWGNNGVGKVRRGLNVLGIEETAWAIGDRTLQ